MCQTVKHRQECSLPPVMTRPSKRRLETEDDDDDEEEEEEEEDTEETSSEDQLCKKDRAKLKKLKREAAWLRELLKKKKRREKRKGAGKGRVEHSNSEETDDEPEVSKKSQVRRKRSQKEKNTKDKDRYGTETETDDGEKSRAGKKRPKKRKKRKKRSESEESTTTSSSEYKTRASKNADFEENKEESGNDQLRAQEGDGTPKKQEKAHKKEEKITMVTVGIIKEEHDDTEEVIEVTKVTETKRDETQKEDGTEEVTPKKQEKAHKKEEKITMGTVGINKEEHDDTKEVIEDTKVKETRRDETQKDDPKERGQENQALKGRSQRREREGGRKREECFSKKKEEQIGAADHYPKINLHCDTDDRDFFERRTMEDTPLICLRGAFKKAPHKGRIIEADMEQITAFAKRKPLFNIQKIKETEPVVRPCSYYNLSTCSWKNVQKHQIVNKQGNSSTVYHICVICHESINAHMAHRAKVCPNARIKYE